MSRELKRMRKEFEQSLSAVDDAAAKLDTLDGHLAQVGAEYGRVEKIYSAPTVIIKDIEEQFKKATKLDGTDITFLFLAAALQCVKSYLFSLLAEKAGYGEKFDENARWKHNDKENVKVPERQAKDKFRDTMQGMGVKKNEWVEILYRKPIFDTTRGSVDIGVNMEGGYHRIHTLGHDPVLGWFFGTANILTDTVTLDTFQTFQGARDPIRITKSRVPLFLPKIISMGPTSLIEGAWDKAGEHALNLPAAIAAESIHLKSDKFTKVGLPVPVLETIVPSLAGKLYKQQYDALCLARDIKIIGMSAAVSVLINLIVGVMHGLLYDEGVGISREMYEVKTRRVLSYSNAIASASNVVYSAATQNIKNLDIGGLIVTLHRIASDAKFIREIKRDFLKNELADRIRGSEYDFMMEG